MKKDLTLLLVLFSMCLYFEGQNDLKIKYLYWKNQYSQ
jgi:hypothetical protein